MPKTTSGLKVGQGYRTDITGMTYGRLTVKSKTSERSCGGRVWLCVCECGNEVKVPTSRLTNGMCRSCGCLRRKACGDVTGRYWNNLTTSAARRGIEFHITLRDAAELLKKQGNICALSGVEIGFGEVNTASLDRINSSEPYVVGNVQWVHKDINYMKMDLPDSVFIAWCQKIADRWRSVGLEE